MPQSLTQNQVAQLQACLTLAQEPSQHTEANQHFSDLLESVAPNDAAGELIEALWNEILTARRSATFWEQISDAEKEMSERLAQKHIQLQQNHLRLMQEQ